MDNEAKLSKLIEERDLLRKKHGDISFPDKEDILLYIETNKEDILRLKELIKNIRILEFEMLSEREKEDYLLEQEKIKEKYSE
ncbi:hypothetical protein ACLI09_10590 [Flavobacterium sp. RHBU_24]|uniref:hypothetical protein n=1 Tax=Flavobacterium sp. RHBU_24 TaxID=3391185 RepID=UPI003984D62D